MPELQMQRKEGEEVKKCSFSDDAIIKLDGVNELDPCFYQDIERYVNVTVTVSKCKKCGNIDISWERQENTEQIF